MSTKKCVNLFPISRRKIKGIPKLRSEFNIISKLAETFVCTILIYFGKTNNYSMTMPLRCGYILVLELSWTDKITNEGVLRRMVTYRELIQD